MSNAQQIGSRMSEIVSACIDEESILDQLNELVEEVDEALAESFRKGVEDRKNFDELTQVSQKLEAAWDEVWAIVKF